MSWFAKPSGAYAHTSLEGKSNIYEIYYYFNSKSYTVEAITGIIANVIGESGLNPWRWQNDRYNLNGGYGLFQYTPASGYINGATDVQYYSPNLSVSQITGGASVFDAVAQLEVFHTNKLLKWIGTCWRTYWDKTQYSDLYATREKILNTYGNGNSLSMAQFATIDNVYDATFAFLACFEGPSVPNMEKRYDYAKDVYQLLTSEIPPVPEVKKKKMPLWMYIRHF